MDKQEADELDWLESNALPPEEDDFDFDDFYPEEIEEEEQPQKQQQNLPDPPLPDPDSPLISDNQTTNKKRHSSPSKGALLPEEKRSRSDPSGTEDEEDWLQYSPPPYENIEGDLVVEEEKFISRFASEIDGNCISVTGADGDRVYAKISHVDTDVISKKLNIRGYSTGLISEPIDSLIDKMEQEALAKALEASSESSNKLMPSETPVVNERLWVEKYSPNSFTELLSDEQTNREVLLWLKQWDSCVFGSEIRSTTDDVLSALRRHSSLSQHQKFSDVNFSKTRSAFMPNRTFRRSDELDVVTSNSNGIDGLLPKKPRVTGSLDQKVLLLCGPPGLGKTTLAHVTAKHCGYRVVEINASDDRSASSIEAKILDVVQMNSIMSDAKPKCLIIDEIDGALGEGKGAVEVILKMVASDKKSEVGRLNGAQEEQPGKVSSKQRRKGASLSRPVICICNDLYAPALRPLRQVAKVHIFAKPTINRVVSRLKYICNKEGFRTNSIALTALAEYTECDIRSCLNTLQFLNKKKENLNVLEISSQVVGRKDMSRSAFDVWKEVFQKRKAKRERKSINNCSIMSSDFDHLHALISNRGEYELTMDGIHENMLQLHYHDPMMQKTVKCLNILGVSDHLHRYIMRTQQMSLYAYQPCTAVAIRCLIAQIERPNIEWPKSFYRYRTTFVEKKDLLRCWYTQISPSLSRHLSTQSFVEDSISPLLQILSPPSLRPVAVHLQSEREKDVLAQLVDTMVSYSMTYKKTKPEFVPYIPRHEVAEASGLAFDPPIDEFIKFKGYNYGHSGFPLAMKQVLMHEVEKQKFLRENINRQITSNIGSNMENQVFPGEGSGRQLSIKTDARTAYAAINMETAKEKSNPREMKTSTSQSLTPGANGSVEGSVQLKGPVVKKPSGGSSSFFDRFRKASSKGPQNSNQSLQKQATMERDSRPLLFKFNEGFTNAVKRPVRVRDLLL